MPSMKAKICSSLLMKLMGLLTQISSGFLFPLETQDCWQHLNFLNIMVSLLISLNIPSNIILLMLDWHWYLHQTSSWLLLLKNIMMVVPTALLKTIVVISSNLFLVESRFKNSMVTQSLPKDMCSSSFKIHAPTQLSFCGQPSTCHKNPQCMILPTALKHYLSYPMVTTIHLEALDIPTITGAKIYLSSLNYVIEGNVHHYQSSILSILHWFHVQWLTTTASPKLSWALIYQWLTHIGDDKLDDMCHKKAMIGLPLHLFMHPPYYCPICTAGKFVHPPKGHALWICLNLERVNYFIYKN